MTDETQISKQNAMKKKLFFGIAILFTAIMIGFSIDFMSKTTRPGKKPQLQERITKELKSDSTQSK
ncbi:MAG: hypothetical protein H7Y04_12875 [Verrucomicrobia bacterium]|nr:hypothetical protein [Cytophagales bacterium]